MALEVPPVAKLPPVTVPVALINPLVKIFPPAMLAVALTLPIKLPTKLVVPLCTALPPILALPI